MPATSTPLSTAGLGLEDFRRLGVRPHECRLTVIRLAAARSSRGLAEKQLARPSEQVGLQLSRVATSAYRLLDPRRRKDVHQRAYVGRILPNALSCAGQTSFHSDARPMSGETPFSPNVVDSDDASDIELIAMLDLDSRPAKKPLVELANSLSDDDLLGTPPSSRRANRARRRFHFPWVMLVVLSLTIGVLLGLATLRSRHAIVAKKGATDELPNPILASPAVPSSSISGSDVANSAEPSASSEGPQTAAPAVSPIQSETNAERAGSVELNRPLPGRRASADDPLGQSGHGSVSGQPLSGPDTVVTANTELRDDPFMPDPFVPTPLVPELPNDAASSGDDAGPALDNMTPLNNETPLQGQTLSGGESNNEKLNGLPKPESEMEIAKSVSGEKDQAEVEDPTADLDLAMGREDAVVVPRRSIPEEASIRSSREQLMVLVPELAKTIDVDDVEKRIQEIESIEAGLKVGTSDSWVARVVIGELAWLIEDAPKVSQRLIPLTKTYQVPLHQLLAETFVSSCDLARMPKTRQHLLSNGLVLADQLLLAESFQDCKDVAGAITESAAFLERQDAMDDLQQLQHSADQMIRASKRAKRVIDAIGEGKSRSGNVGLAGRYYCLMLRRWDTGLPWLVEASDSRIASIARQEAKLPESAPVDDRIEVSRRWLVAASRASGRASDSMRLHAVDLMREAGRETTGLQQLEIERKIEETLEAVPSFLRKARPSVDDFSSNAARPVKAAGTEPEPTGASRSNRRGMSGRIVRAGQDVGVQLNYEVGASFTESLYDTITERTGIGLEGVSIELVGEIHLNDNARIIVSIRNHEARAQRVRIDDTDLEFDPLEDGTELVLGAGQHRVSWKFEPEKTPQAALLLHDAETGRRLRVLQLDDAEGQSTKLTVELVRGTK